MRVLLWLSGRAWSGRARAFVAAGRGLAARGWEVTVACPPQSAAEERAVAEGVDVAPLEPADGVVGTAWRLRRLMRERFVEVTFVHGEREQLAAALASRRAGRGGVVRRLAPGEPLVIRRPQRLAMRLAATGYLFADADDQPPVAAIPGRALEPTVAELGVDVERHEAVRPVARGNIGAKSSSKLIVCVYDPRGRASAATALRTIALLLPRHPELRLVLLGRGSDGEDLRMHAAALGITRLVTHLGERDDHLAILRSADLGWVAADGDDAGFGLLDCMALRVPVLAERSAVAQHYAADGITGVLLPPGDAPGSAAAVAPLLIGDERRQAMGNAGRARVAREFAEAAMVDGFERAASAARDRTRWTS